MCQKTPQHSIHLIMSRFVLGHIITKQKQLKNGMCLMKMALHLCENDIDLNCMQGPYNNSSV